MDKWVGLVRNLLAAVGYVSFSLFLTFYWALDYDLRNHSRKERIHYSTEPGGSEKVNGHRVRNRRR